MPIVIYENLIQNVVIFIVIYENLRVISIVIYENLIVISIVIYKNLIVISIEIYENLIVFVCLMVFNTTFNTILVISWQSVLLVEETGGP
jgi:hypothetical protein